MGDWLADIIKETITNNATESITVKDIEIEGLSYEHILELNIVQLVGQHGMVKMKLQVQRHVAAALTSGVDLNRIIKIITKEDGKSKVIFCGVFAKASVSDEKEYPVLDVTLYSTSYLLDLEKKDRTYKNLGLTHEETILQAVDGKADVHFCVTDTRMPHCTFQMGETIWMFVKRIAAMRNAAVSVDVTKEKPTLFIGLPPDPFSFLMGKSDDLKYVKGAEVCLERGELVTKRTYGDPEDFMNEPYHNPNLEGMMFTGIVTDVHKNKVKVFFNTIDAEDDPQDSQWFEYATPFATNGGEYGSGFYWMPEIGDSVRVFMPTANEGDSFAFGSVSVSPLENPVDAKWRVPNGQEILFTEDGIRITGEENSIYIDMRLSAPEGIYIFSDQHINIDEAKTILIDGKKGVTLFADNKVELHGSETSIEMDLEMMKFKSGELHIN